MKREFKDLIRFEQYDNLNSEIKGGYDKAHAVKCVNGTFVGTEEHGVASWLGIPYAKPPVGGRRFKAPEYVDASDKLFEAKYFGKGAFGSLGYPDCVQTLMSEDCLYLNIWLNADDKTAKKPVMVWIHGGAYVVGSGSEASYSGANLVQEHSDIIFVNINYRLNMYGFMDFSSVPGGENFKTAPCNGLLDQAMALRWVHENIAAFGGDPAKVTIMGESAGAIAVSMLCASPLAKGLFRGAISESGGSFCPVDAVRVDNNGIRDVRGSEEYGLAWMKRIGVSSLSELRETDWEKLVSDEQSGGVGGFWPTVDGYVLPDDQYKMYEAGNYNDVNVLIGTNSDEGSMFVRPTQVSKYQEDIRAEYGPFAERMLQLYPASSDGETFAALSDIFRETAFAWPTWAWAVLQQKTGKGRVYLYYFDQFNENGGMFGGPGGPGGQRPRPRGAGHASELSYVFGQSWGRPFEGPEKAVSDAMNEYWANFVKTGDPNGAGLDRWPVYKDGEKTVMFFKNGTSLIETPNKPQLLLMEEYFAWKRQQPIR